MKIRGLRGNCARMAGVSKSRSASVFLLVDLTIPFGDAGGTVLKASLHNIFNLI